MKLKFDMIGLFVKDMPKMVEFYQQALGLQVEWDGKDPYAEFQHDGIRFAMFQRDNLTELLGKKPSFPIGINGSFELAINVGKPENVDETYNLLLQNGAKAVYEPRNEPWKMRSAMITDPDGNLIEIASDFWE